MIKVSFGPQIIMSSGRGTRFSLYQSLGKNNFMIPWCQSVLSNAVLDVCPIVNKLPNNSFLFPVTGECTASGNLEDVYLRSIYAGVTMFSHLSSIILKYTRDLICSSVLYVR